MEIINFKNEESDNLSPMMRQYLDTAENYNDCIIFFRVGDFYETFFEQAKLVSKSLNLVLTGKDCGMKEKAPMCGVPYHAVDVYMSKLVKLGYKVAIAEQVEDPKLAKGLVKREVTKIITPGTVLAQEYLEDKVNNFILSIYYSDGKFGVAIFDFSTGDFMISNINDGKTLYDLFARFEPKEILVNANISYSSFDLSEIRDKYEIAVTVINDNIFDLNNLKDKEYALLDKLLKSISNYYDIKDSNAIYSSIAAYYYVRENQKNELSHLEKIEYINDKSYMYLDSATIKNLELTESMQNKDRKGTLLHVLDETKTAMGGRLLRRIIEEPLKDKDLITYRQNAVKSFLEKQVDLHELREYLSAIYDLERIVARVDMKHANAKDLIAFKNSIYVLPYLKALLGTFNSDFAKEVGERFDTLKDLFKLIDESIVDDPPYLMHDGNIIKDGFNAEVDRYRESRTNGKQWLIDLEQKEREKTGIKNLKIKYSRLTGYLFEITNAYKGEIPEHFIRKQTLTSSERYTTKELNDLQSVILSAEDRLGNLEYEVFQEVREKIATETQRIKNTASDIAIIDVLSNFAYIAKENNYTCPLINESGIIRIKGGRHPVIEKLNSVETFIANDTSLDNENFIDIITGPNMAGKSTYMRQVALISLMAHIGSFVPAKSADICILDRIFTRVGASDDLTRGKSTFMVEMSEVANIVNNASENSLIILDEIGRGTSTYDGLSIAWSVIEYLSNVIKAKTLFATHYHELTELEGKVNGVNNFNIAVLENNDEIKFLRKIVRGSAKKSYGIAVAKLAGLPDAITEQAKIHLNNLIKKSE
ncbi:MAG: DNA mismatch repair protein MutS [Lachnospiraceae bacterium]|nr:DNA mismatch repair protein MutS [Lachnospiraceae bacterium]